MPGGELDAAAARRSAARFAERYDQLYGKGSAFEGRGQRDSRLPGRGARPAAAARGQCGGGRGGGRRAAERQVLWADAGGREELPTQIVPAAGLGSTERITGPAIVTAATTTILIPPGATASADPDGNLVLEARDLAAAARGQGGSRGRHLHRSPEPAEVAARMDLATTQRVLERIVEAERLGAGSVWVSEHHMLRGRLPASAADVRGRDRSAHHPLAHRDRDHARPAAARARHRRASGDRGHRERRAPRAGARSRLSGERVQGLRADIGGRYADSRPAWPRSGGCGPRICTPPPVQDPMPIWIGATGPRGARMAGRLGEGLLWLSSALMAPYVRGLTEGGHDPGERAPCGARQPRPGR